MYFVAGHGERCGQHTDLRVTGTPSEVVGPTPETFLGPNTANLRPPLSSSDSYSRLMTYTALEVNAATMSTHNENFCANAKYVQYSTVYRK